MEKTYIAIDLKSFYASVECVERGYDPLNTNLVVADESRTDKTICLAVTPSLKSFGIPGRIRLYELKQKIKEINEKRQKEARRPLTKKSIYLDEIKKDKSIEVSYVIAKPRMAFYIDYSTKIYNIYLKYIAAEDMHVYSIDEVFMDVTSYLNTYRLAPRDLAMKIVRDVLEQTGITATVGIGVNLYLAKVAMDIEAKHIEADKDGVRIAELDEMSYKEKLWNHQPMTDFWRVGKGISKRLNNIGIETMGDIARCSIKNEETLYKEFGINAELLIDHAWGIETCSIADIKGYQPSTKSLGVGQVLSRPYNCKDTLVVLLEMADSLVLDLVRQNDVTNQIVLTLNYDTSNLKEERVTEDLKLIIKKDYYGRDVPKEAHGTIRIPYTSSTTLIIDAVRRLFDQIIDKELLVRRLTISFCNLVKEKDVPQEDRHEQFSLFENVERKEEKNIQLEKNLKKERKLQETLISIKDKYGKNSVLKGNSLEECATGKERNKFIGGHRG